MNVPATVNPNLPDYIRQLFPEPQNDLAGDITGGFAVMSIRGRNFRVKFHGTETLIEQGGFPVPFLDVIIVKGSPKISKIFYAKKFSEGDDLPPHCWSNNGVLPDVGVPPAQKQSVSCAACPNNVWGSRINEAGKQVKACSDSRRIAIVPEADPINERWGGPVLLRIPPATLGDLANYGTKLNSQGVDYRAMVTRMSFDPEAAYPKLLFRPVKVISAEQAGVIADYVGDPLLDRILSTVDVSVTPADAGPQAAPAPQPVVIGPPPAAPPAHPGLPAHPTPPAAVVAQPPAPSGGGWGAAPATPTTPTPAAGWGAPVGAPATTSPAAAATPAAPKRGRKAAAKPATAQTTGDLLEIPGFLNKQGNGGIVGEVQSGVGAAPPPAAPAAQPAVAAASESLDEQIKNLLS